MMILESKVERRLLSALARSRFDLLFLEVLEYFAGFVEHHFTERENFCRRS